MAITLERAYGLVTKPGDYLVLVDRLWPRGIRKTELKLDEWDKDIAPSTELRKWFNHEPEKWDAFKTKYLAELAQKTAALQRLAKIADEKPLVLVYSAKNTALNQAVVLKQAIETAQH